MQKLSAVLIEGGLLTRAQVDAALEAQALYGGTLDTCLLELGLCDQTTLEEAIDRAAEAPNIIDPRTTAPEAEALQQLSKMDAARWHVVPFVVRGALLDVLCSFPPNLKVLDEVAFKTGLRVRPSVTSELRVALLVEQYYRVPLPARFHDLARAAAGAPAAGHDGVGMPTVSLGDLPEDDAWSLPADAPTPAPEEPARIVSQPYQTPPRPVPALASAAETEPVARPGAMPSAPQFPPGEYTPTHFDAALADFGDEAASSTGVRHLNTMLRQLDDRESIPEAAFQFLAPFCERVALFTVQQRLVLGWKATGEGVDPLRIRTMAFPLDHASVFHEAAESDLYVGRLPLTKVNEEFARRMGEPRAQYVIVVPVRLRDKVVTFLVGECKTERALERAFSAVVDTAEKIGRTLVRLILSKKQAG